MSRCTLCPHRCELAENGPPGRCRARALRHGQIVALNYGRITGAALDPIEKKPLRRFYPGSSILSVGSFGCNMNCFFCQNAHIAAADEHSAQTEYWSPQHLCDMAQRLVSRGNIGAAFTYNEPLVGCEYVRDAARLLRQSGLRTVVVTNGCFHPEAMAELFPLVDAWNIDLKGFTQPWYSRLGGSLKTVQRFIEAAHQHGHVELTCLVVPGENDSDEEMSALAGWVATLSQAIPLHISRFFPRHEAKDARATPTQTVERLVRVAGQSLQYVYAGNM